jgi:hypothetical protein
MAVRRGHEDVFGLDIPMEQTALVPEVERIGDRGHDFGDVMFWHAAGIVLANQLTCVGAVDVVH